jgi:hypothetical protein
MHDERAESTTPVIASAAKQSRKNNAAFSATLNDGLPRGFQPLAMTREDI